MLRYALAFLAGILLVQQMSTLPTFWWGLLLIPLFALLRRYPAAQSYLLLAAFLIAGVCWNSFRAGLILDENLASRYQGRDILLVGFVDSLPRLSGRSLRFEFLVESAQLGDAVIEVPRRVQLSLYGRYAVPKIDERWRLLVRLKRPHGFQNPGGFDYEGYLFQKRIRARGYVREAQRLQTATPGWSFNSARVEIASRFQALLPESPHQGILIALATGNRDLLTPPQWNLLRDTGTSHLVAISGLHIGIIAGLAFFVFRWLWALPGVTTLYLAAPRFAALGAMTAAYFYAGLAGFSLPTQRALIMLVIVLGGLLFLRRFQPSLAIGGALLAVLLFDPLAVMSAGFWLSFGAVGLILLVLQSRRENDNQLLKLIRIQWALAVGLVPLTLYLFQQASLVAPVANFIAVPLFGFVVVPATLLAAIASLILPDAIAVGLLTVADVSLQGLWAGLIWLSNKTPVYASAISLPVALVAAVGAVVLLLPRGFPARWLGAAGFLPIFFLPVDTPAAGEYRLTMLDVGQGLAVVVQTQHHVLVYDTGPRFSKSFDTGRAVVLPYLRQIGRQQVDTLIVSHGDNDHAGGVQSLLDAIKVDRILSSVPTRFARGQHCYQGQQWLWDNVRFEILSPQSDDRTHENNNSCVLKISAASGSVLIPGDIEREREIWLVEEDRHGLNSDVLIVPHHGSKTSSTASFIDSVQPQIALFPVGYRNRYRHPNHKVVSRYERFGSQILMSPQSGAVEIAFSDKGRTIIIYRQQKRRYWFN